MRNSAPRSYATTPSGLIKSSYQLRPDQVERLDAMALRKGISRSALTRQLIDLGIRQQEKVDALMEAVA